MNTLDENWLKSRVIGLYTTMFHKSPNPVHSIYAHLGEEMNTRNFVKYEDDRLSMISKIIAKYQARSHPEIVVNWLESVNQPVVDEVKYLVDQLLEVVSDCGDFDKDECADILVHIIKNK